MAEPTGEELIDLKAKHFQEVAEFTLGWMDQECREGLKQELGETAKVDDVIDGIMGAMTLSLGVLGIITAEAKLLENFIKSDEDE